MRASYQKRLPKIYSWLDGGVKMHDIGPVRRELLMAAMGGRGMRDVP